jgi:hypothetical protein
MSDKSKALGAILAFLFALAIGICYDIPTDEIGVAQMAVGGIEESVLKADGKWGEIQQDSMQTINFCIDIMAFVAFVIGVFGFAGKSYIR